ncbi:MAG: hypothetical protein O3C40_20610 [Planctomycetota bacterium]|nr:hypothetical protein [Planctomycetota bacterium]
MLLRALFVTGLYFTVLVSMSAAAEPTKVDAETLMCERGKLLLSDDFDEPLGKAWRALKGKWEVAGEAIQGSELKADMHGAVIRANLPLHNAVIQYSFMLEGAKTTTFSINDAKGHNSRVVINAAGFTARKDDHDHAGPDEAAVLRAVKTPIRDGEWHTLVIEINGPDFLARLDGKQVAYGSHDAIDVDKTNIGLTVGGESVSFKQLRIWEATPKSTWPATKAKLVAKSAQ